MISVSDEAGRLANACHRGGRYWYTWRVPGRLSTWQRAGEYPRVSETHDVYFGVNPTHEPRRRRTLP